MENKGTAYHNVLYFLKWAVMLFAAADLVTLFFHPYSAARALDQVFAAVKVILLACSIFRHDYKSGMYFLIAYLTAELGYFFLVYALIGQNAASFTEQAWSYTIGTLLILIPTVVYYRNRQELLK